MTEARATHLGGTDPSADAGRPEPPLASESVAAVAGPSAAAPARRVLMVLFHYPPIAGVPVARNVRNVESLAALGWMPVVLTTDHAADPQDPGAVVPSGASVRRTRFLEPADLRPYVAAARRVAGLRRRGSASAARVAGATSSGAPATEERAAAADAGPSLLLRAQRLAFVPDNQVGWLPFAVTAALREHRRAPYEVVYSTSAPYTAHLIAGIVKRLTGAAWVAEFRDPWVGNPVTLAQQGPRPWLQRRLHARLERWVVMGADRLVFLSASTARAYRHRYPLAAAEVAVITNGHDRADKIPVAQLPEDRPAGAEFRIVWTGTLDRPHELQVLLAAASKLLVRRPDIAGRLVFEFYGSVSPACRAIADDFAGRGLAPNLRFQGYVPRRDALAALAAADAGLVMLGAGPGMGQFVPGKLFDCIGQNCQVLAMLPPGDARAILEELDWGIVADPDVEAVAHAIERVVDTPRRRAIADPAGRYDRSTLSARLASTLGAAVLARRGSNPHGRARR